MKTKPIGEKILIKRFEVGKKLYLTYDLEEIRKSSLEFKDYLKS